MFILFSRKNKKTHDYFFCHYLRDLFVKDIRVVRDMRLLIQSKHIENEYFNAMLPATDRLKLNTIFLY